MDKQKKYNECQKQISCSDCKSNISCEEWVAFVSLHNDKKSYAHFDKRISLEMPTIRQYVMNEQKIVTHSFYPFIHFTKTISRYRKKQKKQKKRELYYCSHLDRCVYQRYAFLLNQKYNEVVKKIGINDVAIAYRSDLGKKNNIAFAKMAFDAIRERKHCLVIVGDFTNFFDKLNHEYLKGMLCYLLDVEKLPQDYFAVYKNITRFASWDWELLVKQSGNSIKETGIRTKLNNQETLLTKSQFKQHTDSIVKNKNVYGIPQGSPISAVLSNVYMLNFDKEINDYVSKLNGTYMRYSDDFLIVLPYENEQEISNHKDFIFSQVDCIEGLELQKDKTSVYIFNNKQITKIERDETSKIEKKEISKIDYLGFIFDGIDIKLRPKSITKYYYRMRRKAKTIGRSNWKSPTGRNISAKNLYNIYSSGGEKQTFIDYAKRAKYKLKLNDAEADSLIKNHKQKIAHAIKDSTEK